MAITINGSGTITGISQGGLPDDCVDAGTIKDSDYQAPLTAGTDYLAPTGDGSSLTGIEAGNPILIGVYTSSTTVSLDAGTYLLVPAGGGGGSRYGSGSGGSGGTSTIVLDGYTATGHGGAGGDANHLPGGSAGGYGGKGHSGYSTSYSSIASNADAYNYTTPVLSILSGGIGRRGYDYFASNKNSHWGNGRGGWTASRQLKTITSTKTATVTVGSGGSASGNTTYCSAGGSGWCAIWKIEE